MKYISTLIAVNDIEKSKQFYHDILGLNVTVDLGANVTLDGGFALQSMPTWKHFIDNKDVALQSNDSELVFEETDMDTFLAHLQKYEISYVHAVKEHSWGQRVVRFYDPDYHIIEVGEDMVVVVKRFIDSGMTEEQVAMRMNVPLAYVKDCLIERTKYEKYTN